MKLFKLLSATILIVMLASCSSTRCVQPNSSCGKTKTYRVKTKNRSKTYVYHKRKNTFHKKRYNHLK